MEAVQAGPGNHFYAVGGIPADVENYGGLNHLGQLLVPRQEEFLVGLRTAQIAGGVVGQENTVGPGINLSLGKPHGNRQKFIQDAIHLSRIIDGAHQKVLYPEIVVSLRPASKNLAAYSRIVPQSALQQ